MNTKLHAIGNSKEHPLKLFVTARQVSDYVGARALFESLPDVDWLLRDRGYNADWFRETQKRQGDMRLHPRTETAKKAGEV
ncbi:hypothetical protein FIU97_19285 (plasmid) [Roseivivax sp. THAF40]|nr:hypothetical protein FIU97_19285 [Roseivivax sp. THAF40]